MDHGFPCAFLAFNSNYEFSIACSFCSDFSLDVLKLVINGINFLVFFSNAEFAMFTACTFFSEFEIRKYVCQ